MGRERRGGGEGGCGRGMESADEVVGRVMVGGGGKLMLGDGRGGLEVGLSCFGDDLSEALRLTFASLASDEPCH